MKPADLKPAALKAFSLKRRPTVSRLEVIRAVLIAIGVALLARAGDLFLTTVKSSQWPEIAVWLGAGILVHDALIGPFSLVLGRLLHPGPVVRAGWLGVGVAVILTIPLIKGAQLRQNPTVVPQAPGPELAKVLVVIAVGMVLAAGLGRLRRRNSRPGAEGSTEPAESTQSAASAE